MATSGALGDPYVREASWLDLDRNAVDIAAPGPPIWRWTVPLRTPGLAVEAYHGAFDADRVSRDALLVVEYPHRLILAVADGATPTRRTPRVGDMDGATYAACAVLEQIRAAPPAADLGRVLHAANARLLERFGPQRRGDLHPRDRPQAAVAVASVGLSPTGSVTSVDVARAADCEVWGRRPDGWSLATSTPMIEDAPRHALERWDETNATATYDERIEHEIRLLDDRSRWNLTALGRFDRPKIETMQLEPDLAQLSLVTDGGNLSRFVPRPPDDTRNWLIGLRRRELAVRPRNQQHDDVALLVLRRVKPTAV